MKQQLQSVHIMLDNETLSTHPNAHIVQTGLVHFCPETFEVLGTKVISMDAKPQPGTHIDVGTVYFWFNQLWETQQAVFIQDEDKTVSIQRACGDLYRFVMDACRHTWEEDRTPTVGDLHQAVHIWAKPARFDIPQWENAFRHASIEQLPWHRRNVNCVQTCINKASAKGFQLNSVPLLPGIHQPLNDCYHQISILKAISEFERT
ncbi:TPA: 3'-5' exoribonuclease [Kluyvera ascorbata]|uniref:3'-5' exonuclease n=1 Tax=Kluyvera ascorbata TaxID=51288 RepID=UPI00289652FC|nr:3'-5' exonuclease [Kluyvera ascorbata]HED3065056.1 3'-5' exoribonuclease [Kluyvera ascorbata]